MISTCNKNTVNINNQNIDLNEIQALSPRSKNIITELGITLPIDFAPADPLKQQIQTIKEIQNLLTETQQNSTKIKLIAFLKTAFLVALLAGLITGCVFSGGSLIALIIIGFFSYAILASALFHKSIMQTEDINKKLPGYIEWFPINMGTTFIAIIGGGIIMPLVEAFTRESFLKEVLEKQQEAIKKSLQSL